MPFEDPFVPRMYELEARMLWHARPIPPAYLDITAHCWKTGGGVVRGRSEIVDNGAWWTFG